MQWVEKILLELVIEGLSLFLKEDREVFFNIFGKETLIIKEISQYKNILPQNYKIINCESQIEDKNSVRDAIKVGQDSSMWKAIESVKNKESHLDYILRKHWSLASYLKTFN